jgi:monoamine oxidase
VPLVGVSWFERLRADEPATKPRHIIVVGAGMAGLVAAYELEQKGHTVTLLEAESKHLGGRIRTHHFASGTTGELGAMRIPKQHELTRRYVRMFKLELRPFIQTNPEACLFVRGQLLRQRDGAKLATAFKLRPNEIGKSSDDLWAHAVTKRWKALSAEERNDLFAITPRTEAVRTLDKLSVAAILNAAGLSDEAQEFIAVTQAQESLLPTAITEAMRDEVLDVYGEGMDEIVGGMEQLPLALVKHLKVPPRVGCEVTALHQDNKGVTAVYRERGQEQRVTGDHLICTLPFPVLQRLTITPALTTPKQRAIRTLHYESASKVLFDCTERFWELQAGIYGGGTLTDRPTDMTYYPSDNVAKDRDVSRKGGCLLASYSWGMKARRWAALPKSEVVAQTIKELHAIHPEVAAKGMVRDSAFWNWDTHRWSGGAFSWFMPEQHTQLHQHLLEPEGRIYLAGEHVSLAHSWIQGAIESGLRCVRLILERGRGTD